MSQKPRNYSRYVIPISNPSPNLVNFPTLQPVHISVSSDPLCPGHSHLCHRQMQWTWTPHIPPIPSDPSNLVCSHWSQHDLLKIQTQRHTSSSPSCFKLFKGFLSFLAWRLRFLWWHLRSCTIRVLPTHFFSFPSFPLLPHSVFHDPSLQFL